jgi:hypothetical protein
MKSIEAGKETAGQRQRLGLHEQALHGDGAGLQADPGINHVLRAGAKWSHRSLSQSEGECLWRGTP